MLGLERPLELLGLDDRVDAELALVAVVGVLGLAFAALEQPPGAAVHETGRGGQHELDGGVGVERAEQRDQRLGEGVLVVAQRSGARARRSGAS